MTYEMKILRKEDLSLYLHIKDVVLRDFRETVEYATLRIMPEMCGVNSDGTSYVYEYVSELEPSPTERGRGWVYFDPPSGGFPCEPYLTVSGLNGDGDPAYGTQEQSERVIVYETTSSGTYDLVDWQDYMIDYIDGRIIATRALTNPVVTYEWNYISVVDEWAAIEAADPPVVVIDVSGTDKGGYQLGGGARTVRKVDVHIFATNPAERNDIVETLFNGLYNRSCPLYDFPTGSVLDYDGTFYGRRTLEERYPNYSFPAGFSDNKLTYLFDRSLVWSVSSVQFESVTARHVNLPLIMTRGSDEVMLSDLNAYRSKVSFDMVSYDNRIPDTY